MVADVQKIGGDGRIRTPRPKAQCKGSVNVAKKSKLHLPAADGAAKIFGGEQRSRMSSLSRERPERGEQQEILRGE